MNYPKKNLKIVAKNKRDLVSLGKGKLRNQNPIKTNPNSNHIYTILDSNLEFKKTKKFIAPGRLPSSHDFLQLLLSAGV